MAKAKASDKEPDAQYEALVRDRNGHERVERTEAADAKAAEKALREADRITDGDEVLTVVVAGSETFKGGETDDAG